MEETYITGKPRDKSINILYPLTGFVKNTLFRPYNTYLYWKEENIENLNLIIYFKIKEEEWGKFDNFEKSVILGNKNILNCYGVEDGMVYIYDLIEWIDDVYEFLEGRYSKLSDKAKKQILLWHGIKDDKRVEKGRYIYMTLYPDAFFGVCAEELGVRERDLRAGGELLEKYDLQMETLGVEIKKDCLCVEEKIISL